MIREHPNWEFVGIFADEGISGTSLLHRDAFLRMIEECEKGNIDLILTKSISRFARNSVDCCSIIRKLQHLPKPVGVFFETEHIYSLDSAIEMILTILSVTAQEESHTKSEIMNISIEQRFSRGIFILTELLGFRKDENGNLVINENEADIVRICFYLFLGGYSAKEIADILTTLGCKRKRGSTKWTAGAVIGVLRNEKHCGDVLARKTYTPNYLDHKAKKNRQNRNQYLQRDHHQGIVSRDIFSATQTLIDSHKYMSSCPLPTLKVIEVGFLKGYVPVNLGWIGFSTDDYVAASKSVEENESSSISTKAEYAEKGFQFVRMQMFSTVYSPALRISNSSLTFNAACMKKFEDTEYVELLFNPILKRLAARPCKAESAYAVHWGKQNSGRWVVKSKSSTAFSRLLYQIMGWNLDNVYRVCALCYRENNEKLLLFELPEAEIARIKQKGKPVVEDITAASLSNYSVDSDSVCQEECFGPSVRTEQRRMERERILYANGKNCDSRAKTVSKLCAITDEDISEYLSYAKEIMERVGVKNA